jgi:hypothetical protein
MKPTQRQRAVALLQRLPKPTREDIAELDDLIGQVFMTDDLSLTRAERIAMRRLHRAYVDVLFVTSNVDRDYPLPQ